MLFKWVSLFFSIAQNFLEDVKEKGDECNIFCYLETEECCPREADLELEDCLWIKWVHHYYFKG